MKRIGAPLLALLVATSYAYPKAVHAQSLFDKVEIEGYKGHYLVIKNTVNVRNKPANTAETVSKLVKRDIVKVLGHVKGTNWLAVKRDGKELGYVYAPSLTPMIDASFEENLTGKIDLSIEGKPVCSYEVSYEGRAIEEETIFVSTDYLAHFKCKEESKSFTFDTMMFMSEIPPDLGNKPIYQITINLPEIATGYEEFLSATALFDDDKKIVSMDGVSLEQFKEKNLPAPKPASTPQEALSTAISLQLASFNTKAWKTISGDIPNPASPTPQ